jgi:CBS domain-containing protein
MLVRDLMSADVATATPETPITQVAKLMKDRDVGAVAILHGDQPAGIVTDRDLVLHHLAAGHTHECPVKEAMTGDRLLAGLATVPPAMDILDAAEELGRRRVGRLLVVEDGHLVGILSAGDLSSRLRRAVDGLLGEGEKAAAAPAVPVI